MEKVKECECQYLDVHYRHLLATVLIHAWKGIGIQMVISDIVDLLIILFLNENPVVYKELIMMKNMF